MKRPMTPRGYAILRRELQKLKSLRPEISRAIETARGHGDISENADYDAAKDRSGMVEAKIRDIEAKLALADVLDLDKLMSQDRVVFGMTVKIEDLNSGEGRTITIVGTDESDVERGLISLESPLGRSMIGKSMGEVVKVQLPSGVREYEIIEIVVDLEPLKEESE